MNALCAAMVYSEHERPWPAPGEALDGAIDVPAPREAPRVAKDVLTIKEHQYDPRPRAVVASGDVQASATRSVLFPKKLRELLEMPLGARSPRPPT